MKIDKLIKKYSKLSSSSPLKPLVKGAPVSAQKKWNSFSKPTKNRLKHSFKDSDRDGVPNKWDCQPFNPFKQDTYYRGADNYELNLYKQKKKLMPHGAKKRIWVTPSKKIASSYNKNLFELDLPKKDVKTAPGRSRLFYVDREIPRNEVRSVRRLQTPGRDSDGDGVIDLMDCEPDNRNKQDFDSDGYASVDDPEFKNLALQKQYEEQRGYGRVQNVSGKKIGNTMIAADVIVPSGKTLTLAGLGVKKYVDKAKVTRTDEHDREYKVPRVQFYGKR